MHSRKPPAPKAANATLDFQEIIYLSMPYRTDRQDALSLIAASAGLKFTMMPGVCSTCTREDFCLENSRSQPIRALIIEDDVDFDVNIKEIMGNLNWQLKYNNTIRWGDEVERGAPGCDWDEIYVGQCSGGPNKERLDLHSIVPDPHSSKLSNIGQHWQKEFTETWNLTDSEGIRVISPTYGTLCTMGYGVSRLGAMRMLYHIGGWKQVSNPVDLELTWRSTEGKISGYTMSPPPFIAWRVGGAQDSDNDAATNAKTEKSLGNSAGTSVGLKNSVRKALDDHLDKNYWKDRQDELR
ncbi:hypothetical protein EJ04DRAFT_502407 [Polyplosphaeria fusca]|uniref:Uncharacterized protein n=1 Tax=Polyplosphaeria fusca TaxID=682080 RepID=A0A9P4UYN7_9PLEO|nr:hypothetical protein EJ04DRAFT_502407 [Polyplosphaeria fusca]